MNPMKSSSPEQRLEQAIQYGRDRKYAQAATLLEGLIVEGDCPPSVLLYLGRSYHALGEYPRAVSVLRSYIQTGASGEEGFFFLGRSYLALNLYSRALSAFQKALEINKDSQAALSYLAYTLLKRGDVSSALTFFEKAVEGNPEDQQLYAGYMNTLFLQGIREFQQGNLELARDRLSFIEEKGGDSLLLHLYLGILEREVGTLSKALDHYGKAIKLRPEDPSIRFQHAEIMLLANRPDEAYRELTYLVEQSGTTLPVEDLPSLHRLLASILFEKAQYRRAIFFAVKVLKEMADPDMHLLIGEGYRHLEEYEKAENHYRRAADLLPGSVEPFYGLTMLFWQKEDWESLLKILKKLEQLSPGDGTAAYYKALCLAKLRFPLEQTIPALEEELKKNGPDPYLLSTLGREYLRVPDTSAGQKVFRQALEIKKDMREAYLGLLDTLRMSEDFEALISALEEYLALYPADGEKTRLLIRLHLRFEKYERAIPWLEAYAATYPSEVRIQRALAFCLRRQGKFREAGIVYKRLLSAYPENERFLSSLVYCMSRSGSTREAVDLLEKALEYLSSPSASLFAILSRLYRMEDRLDEALRTAHQALDRDTKNCDIMANLAEMYQEKGIEEFALRYKKNAERCFKQK